MRSKFIILLIVICFLSCTKSDEPSNYNLDVNFEFSILNPQNEDLLDSLTSNHYNSYDIRLYYLINGQRKEVYDPDLDYPRNFLIYRSENRNRIRVFLNYTESCAKPITLIEWDGKDVDTIEAIFDRPKTGVLKRVVYFNGIEIWRWNENSEEYYLIRK